MTEKGKKEQQTDTSLVIVDYIKANGLIPGDKLPSIEDFANMFGCNFSQVRTGLIVLSALGLISLHPRAGSFVKKPDGTQIEKIFSLLLKLSTDQEKRSILNVYELKTILDSEIFQVAAKNRNESEIVMLHELLLQQEKDLHDAERFVRWDELFHLRVAEIARNPLLTTLLDLVQSMIRADRVNRQSTDDIRQVILEDHYTLLDAIKKGDEDLAWREAYRHSNRRKQELLDLEKIYN